MLWLILYTFDSRATKKEFCPQCIQQWGAETGEIRKYMSAPYKKHPLASRPYSNDSQPEPFTSMQTTVRRFINCWSQQNSATTFSNFGTHTGQISPIYLRQQPSLFFQGSSRQVNDALAYRTAIVYSRSLTRTNTDNAWVYYYGATKIIIVTP